MNIELPVRLPRSEHTISRKRISRSALTVLYGLKDNGHLAFLAGGGVRDLLIGRQPKDYDVATDATPEQVRKLFRRCRLIGRRFRLAHVLFADGFIEVATFRTVASAAESDPAAAVAAPDDERVSMRPRFVAREGMIVRDNEYGTPAEDAVRRDFTINALFYDIRDFSVVDYVNGLTDLRNGLIRSIGDPEIRFVEDPVRMLRAVRFAAALGFEIDSQCVEAMHRHHARLALANPHRLYDEWLKVVGSGALREMGPAMLNAGLLTVLLPDFASWLGSVRDGRIQRFGRACMWLDEWRRQAATPPPDLCLAIMMGEYLEQRIEARTAEGQPWFPAAVEVVEAVLAPERLNMAVPRSVAQNVARIMAVQDRFRPGYRGRRRRFREQAVFKPAFEVFRFLCIARQRPAEWMVPWDDAPRDVGTGPAQPMDRLTPGVPRAKRRRGGRRRSAGRAGGPVTVGQPSAG